MPPATGRLVCFRCKSNFRGPKRPMLQCTICKKGWHTYCHGPVVTVAEYNAMYEAESNQKAYPGKVRFSNWRCSMCPTPSWDRSTVVISSDEEENTPEPKRKAKAPSKSASPAARTPVEDDVIDLTEEFTGLSSQKEKIGARETSSPCSRSQTLDVPGWKEYRSPIAGIRMEPPIQSSVTPPPPSATPGESMMIVDDGEVDLMETGVGKVNQLGSNELPQPVPTQSPSEKLPRQTETRLLPQIIKEEMQELMIPPLPESERPRRPRKPTETKRFVSTSRKGKQRMKTFVDFHMPFGPETVSKVDLGTLEDALRKLGLESRS